jgi:hypothetical protein
MYWVEGNAGSKDGSTIPSFLRIYGGVKPSDPKIATIFLNSQKPFWKDSGQGNEIHCGANLNGAKCYFYGSMSDAPGYAETPYPELFDRIEVDMSNTGVSNHVDLDLIIPLKTSSVDTEKVTTNRPIFFGGIDSSNR